MGRGIRRAKRITVLHVGRVLVEGTRGKVKLNPDVQTIYPKVRGAP